MENIINIGRSIRTKLPIFFMVFGPGIITAVSDNDAAGVATYALAGAQFGYSILIVLFLVTILLAVTQEMGARIALIAGKGLGDVIRELSGIRVAVLVFSLLFIANMGTIIADFSALKTTFSMLHLAPIPFMILTVVIIIWFVAKGDYKTNQRIFLLGIILYFSYVISAFQAKPDWHNAITNLFIPHVTHLSKGFVLAALAVLGTTVTPWGQFFVHSYYLDKKVTSDKIKYAQFETYLGAFVTNFFSFFMIVATAATLFAHKIILSSGEQAAVAIKPFAGEFAGVLFAWGLLNAAIMGIIIISLSTAYAFSEFFGFKGSLDAPFEKGKLFYGIFIMQIVIAFFVVMLPSINLFQIVFYTQSLNSLLLPVIFFFLLKVLNNKEIMGKYTNNRFSNIVAIAFSIIIILASLFVISSTILKK